MTHTEVTGPPGTTVYVSFSGQFSDSPRAIYEAVRARGHRSDTVWLSSPSTAADFPGDVTQVAFGSRECIDALETADLVVSSDGIALEWAKRPGATYLQTWHGTPLKRLHHDIPSEPAAMQVALDRDVPRWDLLLSPNPASTPRLRSAFGFRGPIHETGLPRNDVLSSPHRDAVRAATRGALGIGDDQTAVLYAPTWRDDQVSAGGGQPFRCAIDLDDFRRRLGTDTVLLLRLHHMVRDRVDIAEDPAMRDVSDHPDIGDLYLAANLLVTDYSSTMFDFAITGKPMLFFTYDLEDYRDRLRGFYFDLEDVAPGPLVRTSEDLVSAIAELDRVGERFADRYAEFRRSFCALEDGHATDRVLDLLFPGGESRAGLAASTPGRN